MGPTAYEPPSNFTPLIYRACAYVCEAQLQSLETCRTVSGVVGQALADVHCLQLRFRTVTPAQWQAESSTRRTLVHVMVGLRLAICLGLCRHCQ